MDDESNQDDGSLPRIGSGAYVVLALVLIVGAVVTMSLVPSVFDFSWLK